MNIHEYQGKEILKEYGVPVPKGEIAFSVNDALDVAGKLKTGVYVIKAQIRAGGRENAGGIKISESLEEVKKDSEYLLGRKLFTSQTVEEGEIVRCLLVEEGCEISKEYYIGITIDRKISRVVLIASKEGGTRIEEVARLSPEKIYKEVIDHVSGLREFQIRKLAHLIAIPIHLVEDIVSLILKIYQIFIDKDCILIELNPLVITANDQIIALDAKIKFDSNALYRHPDLYKLRDMPKYNLDYIKLKGNIGCMVNGAGLAMATIDIIKYYGGEPANFLDIGGGASIEKVIEAFKVLNSSEKVDGIFVNIFGGIMQCDIIATGIVIAAKENKLNLPLVVRLEGTNNELGKQIIQNAGLDTYLVETMKEGAKKIVEIVNRRMVD
ncbi:MAG: ADP-forming succinate--CoA ligase subunit beta [Vulcanibacillus sp.]